MLLGISYNKSFVFETKNELIPFHVKLTKAYSKVSGNASKEFIASIPKQKGILATAFADETVISLMNDMHVVQISNRNKEAFDACIEHIGSIEN